MVKCRAQVAAEGGMEWRERERERAKREASVREQTNREAVEAGLVSEGDAVHELDDGEPCAKCGKILCYCDWFAAEKELERRGGLKDPFERLKDGHVAEPGQARGAPPKPRLD